MARKAGNSSKSSANIRPMTRSRSGVPTSEDGKTIERTATNDVSTNKIAELTYYTKMKDPTRPSESYKTGNNNDFKISRVFILYLGIFLTG